MNNEINNQSQGDEPRSLGDIVQDPSQIIGSQPSEDRTHSNKRADLVHEIGELEQRSRDAIAEVQSGNDTAEAQDDVASAQRALLDAQAEEIASRGDPSANK